MIFDFSYSNTVASLKALLKEFKVAWYIFTIAYPSEALTFFFFELAQM